MKLNRKVKFKLLREQKLLLAKEKNILKSNENVKKVILKKISLKKEKSFNTLSKTNTKIIPRKFFSRVCFDKIFNKHYGTKRYENFARRFYRIEKNIK